MRKILYIFLTLFILGVFVIIFAFINQDKLIDRFVERQSQGVEFRYELLNNDGFSLITVGTGSPLPSERVQACNAVFAGGKFFVFDVGDGATRMMEKLRLPMDSISGIFITHWHSDHYVDLPSLVNRSWQLGRSKAISIYGPLPVDSIVGSMNDFLSKETYFRSAHHGSEIMDGSRAFGVSKVVAPIGDEAQIIYQEGDLSISSFYVDHAPVDPALGYIIAFRGKKLVISGDTNKDSNVIYHAENADILVHDVMQKNLMSRASRLQEELGNRRNASIANHIQNYHASPLDAAEVAAQANVKKLILSHLTPAPENPVSRRYFTLGLDKVFKGPIILAEDGDVFEIKI